MRNSKQQKSFECSDDFSVITIILHKIDYCLSSIISVNAMIYGVKCTHLLDYETHKTMADQQKSLRRHDSPSRACKKGLESFGKSRA